MWLCLPAFAAGVPEASVARGLYDVPFNVELTADPGDTLRYSLDGSVPTTTYAGPLTIDGTTIVRAMSVGTDGSTSRIATFTYLFPTEILSQAGMDPTITQDPTWGPIIDQSLRELPTLSVVLPGQVSMLETPLSVEWIPPEGDTSQVDCGGEIIGGTSYVYDKSSLRLHFRSEYGNSKWKADLYEDDGVTLAPASRFDALTLRSGNHDSVFYLGAAGQYTRNYWMDLSQLEQGRLAPHGRYFHLYFNGAYRGLYHLRERFDAAWMAEYLGGEEEDYEAINGGSAFDGSGAAWNALVAARSNFASARTWLDVDDFLDYMVLNFYAANAWDWSPDHNWIAAGPTQPDAGGFRFHSADSDICLYYDPTTNILSNAGPSYLFSSLLAEGDPDFLVALRDAIHRNLEDDGPLTVANATDRYQRISDQAEHGIVAETARWGSGWWSYDDEWSTERAWLLDTFFAQRTDLLLDQMRAAGWYPLPAPIVDTDNGRVAPGTVVSVSGEVGELWVTTDGEDPRNAGGSVYAGAIGPGLDQSVDIAHGTELRARLRVGDAWGPLTSRSLEVDEPAPLVLNEWNAADADETVEDASLGTLVGGGGDWIELLVVEDHLDLRGWAVHMHDRNGEVDLRFTDDALLGDLRAGTLITVAEDLPEDPTYDPDTGDWRFHLRAGTQGAGTYISASAFDVTSRDWQAELLDAEGHVRVGAVGEGVNPRTGIGSDEVGQLRDTPDTTWRRWSATYADSRTSSFGAANVWEDGEQDLSGLRGEGPPTLGSGDTGAPTAETVTSEHCGCVHGGLAPALTVFFAAMLLRRRAPLLLLAGCTVTETTTIQPKLDCHPDLDRDGYGTAEAIACGGAAVSDTTDCDDRDPALHPGAPETCDGADQDCDGVIDEEPTDGLPFFMDEDGDGYGTTTVPACARTATLSLQDGDCDDADPDIHPGAREHCDERDEDCDGLASDAAGASSDCPVESCKDALDAGGSSGPTWLILPSGTITEVYCDQTTDGGGWTLGFSRNSAATGSQGDFGDGEVGLDGLGMSPTEASASASGVLGWINLNEFTWDTLVVAAYASGVETVRSRAIDRGEIRVAFGDDGYKLYGGASGYYWCGGDASYTDNGVGQVNQPAGAPTDCKGHGSLGSGWDFSEADYANAGLTLCGGDASAWLGTAWGSTAISYYGTAGGAQALWVR